MVISHGYWHLVGMIGNITFLLTSGGQQGQFHIPTDIYWQKMGIRHCFQHLVLKNGNFPLLLTSCSQEGQFHIFY